MTKPSITLPDDLRGLWQLANCVRKGLDEADSPDTNRFMSAFITTAQRSPSAAVEACLKFADLRWRGQQFTPEDLDGIMATKKKKTTKKKVAPDRVVVTVEPHDDKAATELANAEKYLANLEGFELEGPDDYTLAVQLIAEAKDRAKQADTARKELTKPLADHVKLINGKFKPVIEKYTGIESTLKTSILEYRKRGRDLVALMPLCESQQEREALQVELQSADAPEVPGLQIREKKRAVVTDEAAVIKAGYAQVVVDTKALEKALKDGKEVPGAHLETEESLAVVADKVER